MRERVVTYSQVLGTTSVVIDRFSTLIHAKTDGLDVRG